MKIRATALAYLAAIIVASIFVTPQVAFATSDARAAFSQDFKAIDTYSIGGSRVFVFGESDTQGAATLEGFVVKADGSIGAAHVFETIPAGSFRTTHDSFARLADGTFGFAWATFNSSTHMASVKFQKSKIPTANGLDWLAASTVVPDLPVAAGLCVSDNACGIDDPFLAQDGKKTIGVAYSTYPVSGGFATTSNLKVSTKLPVWKTAGTWSAPFTLDTFTQQDNLIGLPAGGFSLSGETGVFGNDLVKLWSAISKTGKSTFTNSQTIETRDFVVQRGEMVKATSDLYLRFFSKAMNDFHDSQLCFETFSVKTQIWSPNLFCDDTSTGSITGVATNFDAEGHLFVFTCKEVWNGNSSTYSSPLWLDKFVNGVKQSSTQVGNTDGSALPLAITFSDYNEPVIDYFTNSTAYQSVVVGNDTPNRTTLFTNSGTNTQFAVAPLASVGTIVILDSNSTQSLAHFLLGDSAPIPSKVQVITGKAKVGSILKTSAAAFVSPNGVGSVQYQWFACGIKMRPDYFDAASPMNGFPLGTCNPIAGATKASYKIAKAYKGSFISVTATSQNLIGSRMILSAGTNKVG